MEQITLSDARSLLWEYAASGPDGLKVGLASATADQKDYWRGKLNLVIERFLSAGKWRGTWVKVPSVPIYDGLLTLPRMFGSCSGVNLSCGPRPIYSRFWDFTSAGQGCPCSHGVVPVNDGAQTFRTPSGSFYLRVKSATVGDNGKVVSFLGGYDGDGAELYSTATLTLTSGTPATTTQVYTALPRISKVVTTGPVELYSVDVTSAVETLIAVYAPGEKQPAYKQYRVNGATENDTSAECLCKLAYVPVVADTDLVIPAVYGALKHGLKALTYEDTSDDRQDLEWQRAFAILNDDRNESDGVFTPVFQFASDFGAGSIPNVL